MVMQPQLHTWRRHVFHGNEFGTPLQIVGQFSSIPTLTSAYQFRGLYLLCRRISTGILTGDIHDSTIEKGSGKNPTILFLHINFNLANRCITSQR